MNGNLIICNSIFIYTQISLLSFMFGFVIVHKSLFEWFGKIFVIDVSDETRAFFSIFQKVLMTA